MRSLGHIAHLGADHAHIRYEPHGADYPLVIDNQLAHLFADLHALRLFDARPGSQQVHRFEQIRIRRLCAGRTGCGVPLRKQRTGEGLDGFDRKLVSRKQEEVLWSS